MTTQPRSDRHLPEILDALYLGSTPDYRDDVLARATRSRQRPAWTFPGRWFPMVEIARQPARVGRLPWRTLATAVLVLLLIAVAAAVYVGTRSEKLPAPFGAARNGLIAYAGSDAVYTVNPVTGESHKVSTVADGTVAIDPLFTHDGRRVIYETRSTATDTGLGTLWMVNGDGSGLVQLTTEPLQDTTWYGLSPDGRSIVFVSSIAGTESISFVNLDGSGRRTLDLGVPVGSIAFRPPDGKQLLFTGASLSAHADEIYLVNADGTGLRPVVKAGSEVYTDAVWSADGTHVLYSWADEPLHIIAADGTGDRVLRSRATGWERWPQVSPDGTKIVLQRADDADGMVTSIVRADGTGSPVDITGAVLETGSRYQWSPDSTVILARPNEISSQQQLWDPTTGQARIAPWPAESYPTWQRLAP